METLDPECKKTKIKNINQGTYFKFDDTNHEKFMKGSQDVYINFTF